MNNNVEIVLKKFPEWIDRRIADEHGVGRYLKISVHTVSLGWE
jgi:hypothetical protein